MRIRYKLLISFSLVTVLTVGSSVISGFLLQDDIVEISEEISGHALPGVIALSQLESSVFEIQVLLKELEQTPSPRIQEMVEKKLAKLGELQAIHTYYHPAETLTAEVDEFAKSFNRAVAHYTLLLNGQDISGDELTGAKDDIEKLTAEFVAKIIPEFEDEFSESYIRFHEIEVLNARSRQFLIASAGSVVLFTLALSFFLSSRISRPLSNLHAAINRISAGETDVELPVTSTDETGMLARAFNEMADSLEAAQAKVRAHHETLEAEVAERTKELDDARMAAEAANLSKSAFLANMSHEIRTPMNGVVGMAELLSRSELTEDQRRQLQTIMNSGHSLLRIIDDILDISKIEAGKLQVELIETDVMDIAESVAITMAPTADERNVRLNLSISPAVPKVMKSDPVRVRQILSNLLSNAIKFTEKPAGEPSGWVFLTLNYLPDHTLVVEVSDNGVGMTKKYAANLFQPFSQAEISTTRRFGGSGLGLSITHKLVDLMDGTIEVSTELGSGSKFTVRLPCEDVVETPDLSGGEPAQVICLSDAAYNQGAPVHDDRFFAGSDVSFSDDVEALVASVAKAASPVFVVLAMDSMDQNRAVMKKVKKAYAGAGFILMTADRSEKLGLLAADLFVISRYPALPSQFAAGLKALSGQKAVIEEKPEAGAKQAVSGSGTAKGKILLVEDNEVNRTVISLQLSTLGYEIETAENGVEGLSKWKDGRYDLVLTDCHMPEMDGFELTRKLRKLESTEGRTRGPVIAITANAMPGEAERCVKEGMDDYLSKPVRLDELSDTLRKWIPS